MFQNVLLFIHLKMFKIGFMLNVIYYNKLCVACCSVWHRTTVHLVILMWITSCKISWVFTVNCISAAQWCGLVVMCNVQHLVTNHTESQISQEWRAALPSPFTGGWLHMCSFKIALLIHILSTLFSSTSVLFSCTPFNTKSLYIWLSIYILYTHIYNTGEEKKVGHPKLICQQIVRNQIFFIEINHSSLIFF